VSQSQAATVARNLINNLGAHSFARLLHAWRRGTPDAVLATRYATSPRRMGQWRSAIGVRQERYVLHAEIETILREDGQGGLQRQGAAMPEKTPVHCSGVKS
jgi:hypothetical protein